MPLTEVPSCSSEAESCPLLEVLASGAKLLATSPTTNCPVNLDGTGIPVQTLAGVAMKDGSNANPILLPNVTKVDQDTEFAYLAFFDSTGRLKLLKPGTGDFMLTARDGSFGLRASHPLTCVDPALICDNCEPQYVAIWHEGSDGKICLGRMDLNDLIAEFENIHADTNSVDFIGNGSSVTPWKANVKISEIGANLITIQADGLHATIPISASEGNQLQWLPDGLFVPTPTS